MSASSPSVDAPTQMSVPVEPPTLVSPSLDVAPTQIWTSAKAAAGEPKPAGMAWLMLPDQDLVIDQGDMMMLTGSAGAGKSELLEKIASRARQQWGWMGQGGPKSETREMGEKDPILGRCCATVHKESYFDPRKSVVENVRLPLQIAGLGGAEWNQRIVSAMECLQLPSDEKKIGPMHELKPEFRQRVGWARALACDPQLLLIDEAMHDLRDETRMRLFQELKARVQRGGTVIWATRGIPVGFEADSFRWMHLQEGKVMRDERLLKEHDAVSLQEARSEKAQLSSAEHSAASSGRASAA